MIASVLASRWFVEYCSRFLTLADAADWRETNRILSHWLAPSPAVPLRLVIFVDRNAVHGGPPALLCVGRFGRADLASPSLLLRCSDDPYTVPKRDRVIVKRLPSGVPIRILDEWGSLRTDYLFRKTGWTSNCDPWFPLAWYVGITGNVEPAVTSLLAGHGGLEMSFQTNAIRSPGDQGKSLQLHYVAGHLLQHDPADDDQLQESLAAHLAHPPDAATRTTTSWQKTARPTPMEFIVCSAPWCRARNCWGSCTKQV